MAIKKSELYSSLWASCDALRGGMDASQYKDYVLFMLFIKYVSDKYADYDGFEPPVVIPEGASFKDMVALKSKSDIGDKINTQIIQPLIDSNSRLARSDFPDFNDPNKLGEGQAMVERLTDLIAIFQKPELDFSKNRADQDDLLGDAYEYLMRHFASESGKSKGQFYTPSEVSRILAKVIGITSKNSSARTTTYDPTCGSGSLLLKVAAEAGKHITLEGQEYDVTTAGLARMNMILHDFPTATILSGNTLSNPKFKDGEKILRTYDYVVANPPFSDKKWSTGITPSTDTYSRFEWGEPPAKQGDYAYLLHIVRSMKSSGKAACILPHGVLFRGNAEAVIRKNLVKSGILKGIIGLPANLFYGTGIPACILVLDKENASARKGIFMVDASKGFMKDGNKNRLREQDIHKIVDAFTKQAELPRFSRMVPLDEIADAKNDYNLNLPRYIDTADAEDIHDIDGHIRGGIPERDIDELSNYWSVMPKLRAHLFTSAGRSGYAKMAISSTEVKSEILGNDEFAAFKTTVQKTLSDWSGRNRELMRAFDKEQLPRDLIGTSSEDLLLSFKKTPLMNSYDMYQHLMNFWAETMQDDCYLIAADGWVAETYPIMEEIKSGKKKGEMKEKGWACDLVPKQYIVARYFADELSQLEGFQSELDTVTAELGELSEEFGGDEGILKDVSSQGDAKTAYTEAIVSLWNDADKSACARYSALLDTAQEKADHLRTLGDSHWFSGLKNKKVAITLKVVKDRLAATNDAEEQQKLQAYLDADSAGKDATKSAKALLADVEAKFTKQLATQPLPENLADLNACVSFLNLLAMQSELKSKIKELDEKIDALAFAKYPELSVEEIKVLVVDDKWLAAIETAVNDEIDRVSQTLAVRIRELADRYAQTLPELESEVDELAKRVKGHLENMGAQW